MLLSLERPELPELPYRLGDLPMKTFSLALFVSLASLSANASTPGNATFDYTFFGNSAGSYTMVSCDYATPLVRKWMETFGATNIDLYCTGGIDATQVSPLNLHATYTAPNLTGASVTVTQTINSGPFPGDSNCNFDTAVLSELLGDFTNVRVISRQYGCFSAESPYSYDLAILLPALTRN
jgi:hypothetical protein